MLGVIYIKRTDTVSLNQELIDLGLVRRMSLSLQIEKIQYGTFNWKDKGRYETMYNDADY